MKKSTTHVCKACGSSQVGRVTKGSMGVEISIWILGVITGGLGIPVAIGYSVWRLATRFDGCADCHGRVIVPRNSPAGQLAINDAGKTWEAGPWKR